MNRREAIAGGVAAAVSSVLPVPERLTFNGVPIYWNYELPPARITILSLSQARAIWGTVAPQEDRRG